MKPYIQWSLRIQISMSKGIIRITTTPVAITQDNKKSVVILGTYSSVECVATYHNVLNMFP